METRAGTETNAVAKTGTGAGSVTGSGTGTVTGTGTRMEREGGGEELSISATPEKESRKSGGTVLSHAAPSL